MYGLWKFFLCVQSFFVYVSLLWLVDQCNTQSSKSTNSDVFSLSDSLREPWWLQCFPDQQWLQRTLFFVNHLMKTRSNLSWPLLFWLLHISISELHTSWPAILLLFLLWHEWMLQHYSPERKKSDLLGSSPCHSLALKRTLRKYPFLAGVWVSLLGRGQCEMTEKESKGALPTRRPK